MEFRHPKYTYMQHMSIDLTLQKYILYLELEASQPQPQLSYCFSPERIYIDL